MSSYGMDRESFQKLLANAFAMQQSQIDSQSLSAILEVGRLFTRGEVDVDGAMYLIGERVRNAKRNGTPANGGVSLPSVTDASVARPGAEDDDRVSGAFLSHLASTLSAEGDAAVSADMALDLVLQEIVLRASLLINASGAIIALMRGSGMVCRASTGPNVPPPGVRLSSPFDLSAGAESDEPEVCEDTQADSHFDSIALGRLGIRSFVIVPLLQNGKVVGLIEAFSARAKAFGDREIEILRSLSEEILVNVESANEEWQVSEIEPPEPIETAIESLNASDEPLVEEPTLVHEEATVNRALADCEPEPVIEEPTTEEPPADYQSVNESLTGFEPLPRILESRGDEDHVDTPIAGFRILPREAETKHLNLREFWSPLVVISVGTLLLLLGWMLGRAFWPGMGASGGRAETASPAPSVSPQVQTAAGNSPTLPSAAARLALTRPLPVSDPPPEKVPLLQKVDPQYPDAAKRQNIQGEVVLDVGVDTKGAVDDLSVVSGHQLLIPAAITAVSQWRFKPYVQDGQPTPFHIQIKVHFVLR
jgi:TonB family protein